MKFGAQLKALRVEAWKQHYIDYSHLKELLKSLFSRPDQPRPSYERRSFARRLGSVSGVSEAGLPRRKLSDWLRSSSVSSGLYQPVSDDDVEFSPGLPTVQASPMETILSESLLATYSHRLEGNAAARREFFDALDAEVQKIDKFYRAEEERIIQATDAVRQQAHSRDSVAGDDDDGMQLLRDSWSHVFRQQVKLVNFAKLNEMGFTKILKKYEKVLDAADPDAEQFILHLRRDVHFASSTAMTDLVEATIREFADTFYEGDQQAARIKLLSKVTKSQWKRNDYLRLGVKIGMCVVLFLWCTQALATRADDLEEYSGYIPVYRGVFLVIVEIFFYGTSSYLWHQYRINSVFILELAPSSRLTHLEIFEEACNLTLVFGVNMLLFDYGYDFSSGVSDLVYPFGLFLYMVLKFFLPQFSLWKSRRVLLDSLWQIIIAPFGRVRFRDAFLADILTSMVKVIVDIYYSSCFFLTGVWVYEHGSNNKCKGSVKNWAVPIFSSLPLWWRFAQCMRRYYETGKSFPNLANAGKYAVALTTVALGSFHPVYSTSNSDWNALRVLWFSLIVISTLYSYTWDITQDWGLLRVGYRDEHPFLRRQLLYPHLWPYYFAMFTNLLLRFAWSLSILPFSAHIILPNHSGHDTIWLPLIYGLELYRRFQWSLIRLENEQINNPEDFRNDLFVPIHFESTQERKLLAAANAKGNKSVTLEVAVMCAALIIIAVLAMLL